MTSILLPLALSYLITVPATFTDQPPLERVIAFIASQAPSTPGYYIAYPTSTATKDRASFEITWTPRLPGLGTCDDDDDCEEALKEACTDAGHEGDMSDVSQNGCVCSGTCGTDNGDTGAVAFEICNNPGC